jgi:hypothetical protein
MSLYVLGCITYLANMLVHKNCILCNECVHVQMSLRRHTHTHMCLETHEMGDMKFFFFLRHHVYYDACVFLFGCVVVHAFF